MTKAKVARTAAKAHRVDRKVSHEAVKVRETAPMRAAAAVAEIADQPPLITLSAGTILVGAVLRQPAVARAGVRMLASHLLATAIKTAIKSRVDRTRPDAVKDGEDYRLGPGGDHGHELASFPSGHTAGAVAVTRALARDFPESAPYGAAATVAVGAVQLPSANHYASDVVVGAAIGWASEWVVSAALDGIERTARAAIERQGG